MPNWGGGAKCGVCGKTVYFNEERKAMDKSFHVTCFRCSSCGKGLDSTTCTHHDGHLYCKACYGKNFGPKGYGYAGGAAGLAPSTAKTGSQPPPKAISVEPATKTTVIPQLNQQGSNDSDVCPRCGKKVYLAEQMLGIGRKWHKACFRCAECGKSCDSTNATDHEGELYCKACHSRKYGPKGVGYGIGSGVLNTM